MKVILSIALLLAVAHGALLSPDDAPQANQSGQCPSGYPNDGLFTSCALGSSSGGSSGGGSNNTQQGWRIGAINGDWNLNRADPSQIQFPADFINFPVGIELNQTSGGAAGCSIRMPGYSVVFQSMSNLKYAHYKIHACGKALGQGRCKVVMTDLNNRIVDQIDIFDSTPVTCSGTGGVGGNQTGGNQTATECQSVCSDAWSSATVKYLGDQQGDIIVRRLGDTDEANWVTFPALQLGDNFTINAADFPLPSNVGGNQSGSGNNTGGTTQDVLPEQLEIVSGRDRKQIDVISTTCDQSNLYPGQYFGDNSQYLLVKADTSSGPLCAVSDFAGARQCPCEDESRREICMESKGFVALPEQVYFLGLASEECSCSFDNICLSQVGGLSGYFGSPWLLARSQQQQQTGQ